MIDRIISVVKRDGLVFVIARVFARILGVSIGVQRTKDKAMSILNERYDNTVAYGPFKGMKLPKDVWWAKNDCITQMLGIYEEHVLRRLISFSKLGAKRFIDVGAADGYFAVGLAYSKIYAEIHAFEIAQKGRERIRENAKMNSCEGSVHIFGEASFATMEELVGRGPKSAILIDIEGAEYEFLDDKMLNLFSHSFVICELHPWRIENGEKLQADLFTRAEEKFRVEIIVREYYTPNLFPELNELSDEERLITVGEGRERNMQWLVLSPK